MNLLYYAYPFHITNRILEELESHQYYGLRSDQCTLLPQIEVPAVIDKKGTLALNADGHLVMKPHGHGDIHTLLYQYGLPQKWMNVYRKRHVLFMQDTNILAIYGFATLVGLSTVNHLDFTSLGIVRKPGEKVGSICRLQSNEGKSLTCNVEYCDFEKLLMALTGKGDESNENGNSDYPGNINVLYANLSTYWTTLSNTGGTVPEFINPKYADAECTVFQTPARLECMMQDLPRVMSPKARVGYCSLPRWACFSPVKRDPVSAVVEAAKTGYGESFYSMEEDYYKLFRRVLRSGACEIDWAWDRCGERESAHSSQPSYVNQECREDEITQADGVPSTPIILLSPRSSLTLSDMQQHFTNSLYLSQRSILYLDGANIFLENVHIDGTVIIRACAGASVYLKNKHISNEGWEMRRKENGVLRR